MLFCIPNNFSKFAVTESLKRLLFIGRISFDMLTIFFKSIVFHSTVSFSGIIAIIFIIRYMRNRDRIPDRTNPPSGSQAFWVLGGVPISAVSRFT